MKTKAWVRIKGARQEKREVDIFHPTCIITFYHPHCTERQTLRVEKERWRYEASE